MPSHLPRTNRVKPLRGAAETLGRRAAVVWWICRPGTVGAMTGRAEVPMFLRHGASWAWRLLVVAAAGYVLLRIVVILRIVVVPVFVALVLAALLAPLVDRLSRRLPRLVATWITLLGTIGLLVGLGVLLAQPIASAANDFVDQFDALVADLESWLQTGPLDLSESRVEELFDRIGERSDQLVSGVLDEPATAARLAAEVVGGAFLALATLFFLLKDGPEMWAWTLQRIEPVRRTAVDAAGRASLDSVQGWLRGVAIGGALAVLGIPAALPLGVITFFAAFFPIVGATVAGAIAVGIALASEGVASAIIVGLVVLAVQQIEGDVLLPVVMKRQVHLHPVVVLVVLGIGAAIGGIVGALVAVPVTAAMVAGVAAIRASGPPDGGLVLPGASDDAAPPDQEEFRDPLIG